MLHHAERTSTCAIAAAAAGVIRFDKRIGDGQDNSFVKAVALWPVRIGPRQVKLAFASAANPETGAIKRSNVHILSAMVLCGGTAYCTTINANSTYHTQVYLGRTHAQKI